MPDMDSNVRPLLAQALKLQPNEQLRLACAIAKNIGYALVDQKSERAKCAAKPESHDWRG